MPELYGGTWPYIAKYFGEGIAKGATEEIAETRGVERALKSFRRLAPLRAEQREEEFAYETRRGRAKGELEAEFKQAQEAREAESALKSIGPYLSEMLGTTGFPGAAGERRQQQVTPYEVPTGTRKEDIYKLLDIGKEREKARKPTGRAPTMTELYIAASQGNPAAKAAIKEYENTQVEIFGGKFDIPGTRPPDISPGERGTLAGAGGIREQAETIRRQFEAGGGAYVGPWTGGEGLATYRRLLPGLQPSLQEEQMRTSVNRLFNEIMRLESGLTQSQLEELRQYRVLPTMGTTPEKFLANLEGAVAYADRVERMLKTQLGKSRRMQRLAPRPDWELVE